MVMQGSLLSGGSRELSTCFDGSPFHSQKTRLLLPIRIHCSSSAAQHGDARFGQRPASRLRTDISPHRAYSVVRLLRIEQGGAYADVLGGDGKLSCEKECLYVERTLGFQTAPLEPRSQRQVTELVAGVTRWKRYLDFLIKSYYDATLYDRMEPLLKQILRLGVYELVKLETPAHAAVNETVELGKIALQTGAGNLLNGVLRKISLNQKAGTLTMPNKEGDARAQARALAILHSHPVWMVRRWLSRYGEDETTQLMKWNNTSPTYALRANSAKNISREKLIEKIAELEVAYEPSCVLDDFVRITTGMQSIIQAGLVKNGICAVQDESAGLVVRIVNPQPGDTIVDCCAAPGGKALFMAARLENQGKIWAIDINQGRLHLLEATAKTFGLGTVVCTHHGDLCNSVGELEVKADKVLVDAPCSGLGVLAKRADLRWRKGLDHINELQSLQQELLNAAARFVKPGGVLVYSTCSIEPEENEQCVSIFLKQHLDFMLESVEPFVPQHFVTKDGYFSSLPHKHHMDGAFAARMRRSLG